MKKLICFIALTTTFSYPLFSQEWVPVGGVFDDQILTLHDHEDNLFIGGFFKEYENTEMKYIAMMAPPTSTFDFAEKDQVRLFPNPANSEIHISSTHDLIEVEVFSPDGRPILKMENIKNKETTIDLHGLPSNIYFVRSILDGYQVWTFKVVKNP